MNAINLETVLLGTSKSWQPATVARFNGNEVMVAKASGSYAWHKHDDTDDFFLVLKGNLTIEMRDGSVHLGSGELFVFPKGVEHTACGFPSLLNRSVDLGAQQDDEAVVVSRKVNRATAAKALSRCVRTLLLHVQTITSLIHDWADMMGRSLIRHVQGRNQPRKNTRHKPHPSQAYKRAA